MEGKRTTILDIPHEILDSVFSYLAWRPHETIVPSCPDIVSISLSCRTLRQAVLPTLFRNVRLKLHWTDGAIAAPGLCKLRQEAPQLLNLVRCVHIKTEYGHDTAPQLTPFTIPLALNEWVAVGASITEGSERELRHRERIMEVAHDLYGCSTQPAFPVPGPRETQQIVDAFFASTETRHDMLSQDARHRMTLGPKHVDTGEQASQYPDLVEVDGAVDAHSPVKARRHDARRRRLELDALIICMVCLPSRTQSLVFESVPGDSMDQQQYSFSLQVCAMALKIFAGRLQRLTLISRPSESRRLVVASDRSVSTDEYQTTLIPVIGELHSVTRLTLASSTGFSGRFNRHDLNAMRADLWNTQPLVCNVTHLTLRHVIDKRSELFNLIKDFTSLAALDISDVRLSMHGVGQHAARPEDPQWLLFLISVRLHRPMLRLHLGKLGQWHEPHVLPRSAARWLEEEAVPVGSKIDFERETRLTEDFGSFMSLWEVDDGDRGGRAREDEGVGKLVDDAFTSRWRTFANLR